MVKLFIYYPSLSLCAESSGLFGRSTREEEKPQPHSDTKKPQVNSGTHTHSISFFLSLSKKPQVSRSATVYSGDTHTHYLSLSKLMGLLYSGHTHTHTHKLSPSLSLSIIYLSLQPEVARKPKRSLGSTSSTDATSPLSPAAPGKLKVNLAHTTSYYTSRVCVSL